MATYASESDDDMSPRGGRSSIPPGLFSDSDDDDRSRGGISEAEEDNSLNRREGYGGGASASQKSGRAKNSDEEEEEEERRRAAQKKEEEKKKKKPKGPVRRQMISEDMLIGKNGISKLPELFKDFQFGGKGRERQDLDKILAKLEHWIHLLHPKQPFDQCLQRIEFLGGKRKVVKTHLKKLRMGMLQNFEENDIIVEEDDDDNMINNIDATELAESASAFVNAEENELAASMSAVTPTTSGTQAAAAANDSEFPDDDDFFETIDDSSSVVNRNAKVVDEMDIDMEDVPQVDEDDDDDFIMKQIEAQLKRAQEADKSTQQQQDPTPHPSGAENVPLNVNSTNADDTTLAISSVPASQTFLDPTDSAHLPDSPVKPNERNESEISSTTTKIPDSTEPIKDNDVTIEGKDIVDYDAIGINLDDLEDNED